MSLERVLSYLDQHRQEHLEQLVEFLRIPSISAVTAHKEDVRRAALFVQQQCERLGLSARLVEGAGNPIVHAESEIRPGRPTLLFYGHYDVQPVDPLAQWTTPPFEPRVEDGVIWARGASDDKGQLFAHLKALEAYAAQGLELPVNVRLLIEGEEECGGHSIYELVEKRAAELGCDAVVVSDTSMYDERTPAICYSLRGMAYMEIRLRGPKADLHSGSFGGGVQNPANAICAIVAKLKDADGRVLVPGFYDDVLELDAEERRTFASLGYTDEKLLQETGSPAPFGEKGYTTLERMWGRPTCDVNGVGSGYQGEGGKTIIPATAFAKVSMRLVPNQKPRKIAEAFTAYVRSICPPGVELEVVNLHGAEPVLVPRDSAMMQAGLRALERGFGGKPVFVREGGSIPIVGTFQQHLKAPVLLLGFGLSSDAIHSPNEHLRLENFYGGIRTSAILMEEAARVR